MVRNAIRFDRPSTDSGPSGVVSCGGSSLTPLVTRSWTVSWRVRSASRMPVARSACSTRSSSRQLARCSERACSMGVGIWEVRGELGVGFALNGVCFFLFGQGVIYNPRHSRCLPGRRGPVPQHVMCGFEAEVAHRKRRQTEGEQEPRGGWVGGVGDDGQDG